MKNNLISILLILPLFLCPLSLQAEEKKDTYDETDIIAEAGTFLGTGAEGIGDVVEKIFKEHGRPNAIITGEEGSGAIGIGARYGNGILKFKSGASTKIHWTGPSIGFDAGGNYSKVFTLVYNLPSIDVMYQRFPAIEGSFYYIGGVGVNYHQSDKVILAPMRVGVGLRGGVNIGYVRYSKEKTWNPF